MSWPKIVIISLANNESQGRRSRQCEKRIRLANDFFSRHYSTDKRQLAIEYLSQIYSWCNQWDCLKYNLELLHIFFNAKYTIMFIMLMLRESSNLHTCLGTVKRSFSSSFSNGFHLNLRLRRCLFSFHIFPVSHRMIFPSSAKCEKF